MLFEKLGIKHQTSVKYTPEQNGRAEREMRSLVEAARSMIHKLNKKFWAEAINMAAYVINRTGPTQVNGKTPYELFYKREVDITMLQEFGVRVSVHIPKQKRLKWDRKKTERNFCRLWRKRERL